MAPASASGQSAVPRTPDGRFIVVNGRKWRATDPSIPEKLRVELVGELMAARRAVRDADSEQSTAAARRRVHDAKVALGERGDPWWEPSGPQSVADRTAAALRTLLRRRDPESTVCPSDLARIVGGAEWRNLMDAVRAVAADLQATGAVELRQKGKAVAAGAEPVGPIRIGRGARFDTAAT